MLNRLKKLHKLWKITKEVKPPDEQIDIAFSQGKGEFLSEFDEEELKEHIKMDGLGWRPFYDRIKNVLQ